MGDMVAAAILETARTKLLQDFPRQVRSCVDVLTDEQLWWRPSDHANAIANLLLHLAGSNRYHLEHVLAGAPNDRDRDWEFQVRSGRTNVDPIAAYDEAVRVVGRILEGLTPERLTDRTDVSGRVATLAHLLLHVTHHNALHVGQIVWMTKMLAPGVISDLSMHARAR